MAVEVQRMTSQLNQCQKVSVTWIDDCWSELEMLSTTRVSEPPTWFLWSHSFNEGSKQIHVFPPDTSLKMSLSFLQFFKLLIIWTRTLQLPHTTKPKTAPAGAAWTSLHHQRSAAGVVVVEPHQEVLSPQRQLPRFLKRKSTRFQLERLLFIARKSPWTGPPAQRISCRWASHGDSENIHRKGPPNEDNLHKLSQIIFYTKDDQADQARKGRF